MDVGTANARRPEHASFDRTTTLAAGRGLCPICAAPVPSHYVRRDDAVVHVLDCLEHGLSEAQVWADADEWLEVRGNAAAAQRGCGSDAGDHTCCVPGATGGKRCLAVVNVTDACDLECSYCFASSGPGGNETPRATVRTLLETTLREAGGPIPIQLSGGEPTTRDDLVEIVHEARQLGFKHIEVNTNGVRMAREPDLAARLREAGVSALYLQFDGFGDAIYERMRGARLDQVKADAVAAARAAGLPVILVPTIVPGVNDDQLGQIVEHALANRDIVRGVNFQPVSHFGRFAADSGHLDVGMVRRAIEAQTGWLRARDLYSVPCCDPRCSAATMVVVTPLGPLPLTRLLSAEAYRDMVTAFDERGFVPVLAGDPEGMRLATAAASCCGIDVPSGALRFLRNAIAVSITGFMDAQTMDLDRLESCCIQVPTADGRLVPFCGYNYTTRDGTYALRASDDTPESSFERNNGVGPGFVPLTVPDGLRRVRGPPDHEGDAPLRENEVA